MTKVCVCVCVKLETVKHIKAAKTKYLNQQKERTELSNQRDKIH